MEKSKIVSLCFAALFLAGWCAFLLIIELNLRIQEFQQTFPIVFSYYILLLFGFFAALGIYSYSMVYKDKRVPFIAVIIAWAIAFFWAFSL
ncbi:MAG: hypothetical protein QW412_03995 [Candidatus Aenigmatarchaeota archaeon]